MAAQFTSINGACERFDFSCNQRATSSLPEPFAPVISTLASVGATRSIVSLIRLIAPDSPNISLVFELLTFRFNTLVSVTRELLSNAFRTVMSNRFRSSGFSKKSKAPFFAASTAVSIVPWPEIIIKGISGLL
ncbi:hypothetical protein D3C81_1078370 [compost metagenome]